MTHIRMPSAVSAMVLRAENLEPCAIDDVDAFRDAMELFATHLRDLEVYPDDFHSIVLSAVDSAASLDAVPTDAENLYTLATHFYFFLLAQVGFSQGHARSRVLNNLLSRNDIIAATLADSYRNAREEELQRELSDISKSTHTVVVSRCPETVQ